MALLKSAYLVCFMCFHMTKSQDGWFGPSNEFKCHCESSCSNGMCQGNGKCARGWFGLKCQHQDLTVLENTSVSPSNNALTDGSDDTCLSQPVTVTFNRTYVFTWLRLTVKGSLFGFTLQFSKTASTSSKIECLNQKYFLVDTDTIDIQCDLKEAIQTVIITWTGQTSLCSLYINGGRNVALKQKTWQTSNYSEGLVTFDASKAVDGNTTSDFYVGSCTHTNVGDSNPMWTVTFPISEITRYVLYNRNNNMARLAGFVLVGENSGSQKFNYNDPLTNGLDVYIVVDSAKNNLTQVKISTKQFVTLCEVQIYGECPAGTYTSPELQCTSCPVKCANICHQDSGLCNYCNGYSDPPNCIIECVSGRFGMNCVQTCENCVNSTCDRVSGFCPLCKPGYYGNSCDKVCNETTYGQNCSKTCSTNCTNKKCDPVSGKCNLCFPGFIGDLCDQSCNETTYGQNCSQICSNNCTGQKCDGVSGKCKVCNPGYKGDFCNQTCDETTYGQNCSKRCSTNCTDQKCDKVNGKCNLCIPGYKGDFCNQTCNEKTYGQNCSLNCSTNCSDQKCDSVNGKCSVCIPGYIGEFCNQTCNSTYFGQNCTRRCSVNCTDQKCNHISGTCNSCYPGYQGDVCNQFCNITSYGQNCSLNCSASCVNESCHPVNGTCDLCYSGYHGDYCEDECQETKYGQNCLENCSSSCTENKCHHIYGTCFLCYAGLLGDFCNITCPPGQFGQNCSGVCNSNCNNILACNNVDGHCYNGCKDGYIGNQCDKECENQHFGLNCTQTCSVNCLPNSTKACNHVSGACLYGCAEDYSGTFCQSQASTNVGAIVGSIIAIIIVAVLVAVGAIIWKRKYYKKPDLLSPEEREFTRLTPEDSITVQEKDHTSTEQNGDATYCNFDIAQVNTKIAVDNLNDYLLSHKDEFLIEQYRSVPKPKNVTTDVGVSEENRLKNRYKNICPYDHSRVHLMINTEKQEGDYINASYVRGDSNDVKFIAAQGPFSIMVNDFVRMLWEQRIEKVVMLTNLIEEGKSKCDKYWPDSGKIMFGDIKVKLTATETFADYTIRKIQLEKKDAEARHLTHYHFTSWPDQGVPMTPWALVDFEQRVDINSSAAPVVVHCSAGVGRTGTFIALHNIMSQAMHTGHIDFYNTLVKLREDRFLMIQTPDQYVFLHKAAQAAIVSMGTTVTSIDSQTRFNHLQQKTMTGMSNMENEFQSICAICRNKTELQKEDDPLYQNTETLQKDSKNRFSSIVPKDCYRPFLQRDSKDMGDYINAVFVQGFHKKDQQILTQLPMPSTLVSFWKLVTQYKVSLIVAFDMDKMNTDQTIANYLPSSEKPLSAPPYEIQSTDLKEDNLWIEQTIKIVNSSSKIEHSVIHLKCKVHDPDAMRLLTYVNKSRSYNALVKGRILYTCRDGATYSGLACVLSLLLDRMDHDTCWTVPLVVGSVKSIRPQVIPTFKQYNTLHDALQKYNEMNSNDNTYGNVDENFFPKYLKSTRKEQVQSLEESEDGNIYSNLD